MAAPTTTAVTPPLSGAGVQAIVGMREDLSDIIFNISPTDTPFLSGMSKTRSTSTFHEWQTDSLAAASNNAQVEGNDAALPAIVPTVRLGNYNQISSKSMSISGTVEAVNKAGRRSEIAYQLTKQGRELKRDMEFA